MNKLVEIILNAPLSTWVSLASLSVAIVALIISYRRQSFDAKLLGEKKVTEIRSLVLDYKRRVSELLKNINELEKVCKKCDLYPENNFIYYRESVDSFLKFADKFIKVLDKPTTKDAALILEPMTAYCDDLCKSLTSINEDIVKMNDKCCSNKK